MLIKKHLLKFDINHHVVDKKMIEYHIFYVEDEKSKVEKNLQGILEFYLPKSYSNKEINDFINWYFKYEYKDIENKENNNFWISKYLNYINIFTKHYFIKVIEGSKTRKYEKILDTFWLHVPKDSYEERKNLFKKIYQDQCYAFFEKRTFFWAKKMGIKEKIKIEFAWVKSYYGICYIWQRKIKYCYSVCAINKELIDYLIVHEVSHILFPNHSREFWNFVEKFCPNYRKYRSIMQYYKWKLNEVEINEN